MTRRWSIGIATVLGGALAVGCGTPIFDANFDADAVGGLPNTSPPGDPVGDEIVLPPPPPPLGSPRVVAINGIPGFTGNVLTYGAYSGLAPLGQVSFRATPVDPTSQRYMVNWKAMRRYTTGVATVILRLHNGAGEDLVRLEVRTERYYIGSSLIAVTPDDVVHEVLIVVDKPSRTYSVVLMDASGRISGSATDRPLLSSAEITRPTLVVSFSQFGGTRYFMDEVLITEECPNADGELDECP